MPLNSLLMLGEFSLSEFHKVRMQDTHSPSPSFAVRARACDFFSSNQMYLCGFWWRKGQWEGKACTVHSFSGGGWVAEPSGLGELGWSVRLRFWCRSCTDAIGSSCCSVAKSSPILCDPMDCNLPDSSVHRISQERILNWLAISFSRGSSRPRDWTHVFCIGRHILYHWVTWEAPLATVAVPAVKLSSWQHTVAEWWQGSGLSLLIRPAMLLIQGDSLGNLASQLFPPVFPTILWATHYPLNKTLFCSICQHQFLLLVARK